MITYKPYHHATDAHDAVDLWNSVFGDEFPLDLRLWRQNVDQSPHLMAEASLIARDDSSAAMVGFLIVKSPKNICAVAVAPEHRRQGIATDMIAMAQQSIGGDSGGKWIVGQDYNHFFPGVPEDAADAFAFFERLGYQRGDGLIYDLHRDMADYEIAPEVRERIELLRGDGIVIRPCTERDLSGLIDHIGANFSQRWLADTIARLNVETNPSEIIIASRIATGEVIGFAHTWSNRSRYVGPSIYWRPLLGPKYGGLGPIGVSKDVRKIGLGLALLAQAVQEVKDRGATQMAIDWTVLVDFYAKVGFTPWKKYVSVRQP